MQTELFIAVLAGIGGMLGWGLADFFAKKTIDKIGDIVSLAWGHILGTVVLLLILFYRFIITAHPLDIPQQLNTWLFLVFFGALQAIVYLLVYKGFAKGPVGLLSPVFAAFSGLTAAFSILFLGEILSGNVLLGLTVLFFGIILINLDIKALKSKRLSFIRIPGIKEVGSATLLATIWTLSWDKFVGDQDWLSYTLFMYFIMTIVIIVIAYLQRVRLSVKDPTAWKFLLFIGFCETVAYAAISLGYSATSLTSVVALLSGAFSLPTIILARLFLKERITIVQTVGSLIIIFGIMLLSVL